MTEAGEEIRCPAINAAGERCELQNFHSFDRHQVHISRYDRRPIVEWPVTEWDCTLTPLQLRALLAQREAVIAQGQQENDRLKEIIRARDLSDALQHGDLRENPSGEGFQR